MRERLLFSVVMLCCLAGAALLRGSWTALPAAPDLEAPAERLAAPAPSRVAPAPRTVSRPPLRSRRTLLAERPPARPPRTVAVRVRTHSGRLLADAAVVVERRLRSGPWVHERQARTNGVGTAVVSLPDDDAPRRASTTGSTDATALLPHTRSLELRTHDRDEFWIELVDSESTPLPGARAVEALLDTTRWPGRRIAGSASRWSLELPHAPDAPHADRTVLVTVTDTLGRRWHREVTLRLASVTAVRPEADLTVLRSACLPLSQLLAGPAGNGARLRWSLDAAGRSTTGSSWLTRPGFHAVARRSPTATDVAQLEIHASAPAGAARQRIWWPLANRTNDLRFCKSQLATH